MWHYLALPRSLANARYLRVSALWATSPKTSRTIATGGVPVIARRSRAVACTHD
jgi:hypothetical protein